MYTITSCYEAVIYICPILVLNVSLPNFSLGDLGSSLAEKIDVTPIHRGVENLVYQRQSSLVYRLDQILTHIYYWHKVYRQIKAKRLQA